ncbi:MAG: hypothetical protein IAG13_07955 [Deltaproteobacteria bacterium]|nr:hypothetical protein [Nannocystaceae bacterium]
MVAAQTTVAPATVSLQCDGCGAQIQVEVGLRTAKCPYCASPAVVERPADPSRPDPTFVIGFVIPKEKALERAREWIKRPMFAPGAFRRAQPSDLRGLYVPAYLYTAVAHADYSAEIGENYTVTETYTTTDSKGNAVTRTRTRIETEWRSLQGSWSAYVDDILVTASRGLPDLELDGIEPFDLRTLARFSPKMLAGWIAEDPSIVPGECQQRARAEIEDAIGRRLAAHMPGDKHRSLHYQFRAQHEDLELVMLPVWVLAVRYAKDKPPVRLVLNGQTGQVHGRSPLSWTKIVVLSLIVIAIVVVIALVMGNR